MWVAEDPPSRLEEWAARDDDYHVGFLAGVCISGMVSTVVYGLAVLIGYT